MPNHYLKPRNLEGSGRRYGPEPIDFHRNHLLEHGSCGWRHGIQAPHHTVDPHRVTYGQVSDAERRRVRRDLEEYCGLDTLGMIQIVAQLKRLTARADPSS